MNYNCTYTNIESFHWNNISHERERIRDKSPFHCSLIRVFIREIISRLDQIRWEFFPHIFVTDRMNRVEIRMSVRSNEVPLEPS